MCTEGHESSSGAFDLILESKCVLLEEGLQLHTFFKATGIISPACRQRQEKFSNPSEEMKLLRAHVTNLHSGLSLRHMS